MKTPFFSIIVPVYNTPASYLEACLESLEKQTFTDIEILLVDDGSEKQTADILDRHAETDNRVKPIHQKNHGVSFSRNQGIRMAEGTWIMFVDADDWLEYDACEKLHQHLMDKQCDLLLFNADKVYTDQRQIIRHGLDPNERYDFSVPQTKELFIRRTMVGTFRLYFCWDKVYRRDFLVQNELFFPEDVRKSEDRCFILYCFEKLSALVYVEDLLYHYRMDNTSICHKYSSTADSDRKVLAAHLQEIADRMDKTLGQMFKNPSYDLINREYMKFLFLIIADVLRLKFYHPDNPNKKTRRKDAVRFIRTELFSNSIRQVKYKELNRKQKLRKLLLTMGFVDAYYQYDQQLMIRDSGHLFGGA